MFGSIVNKTQLAVHFQLCNSYFSFSTVSDHRKITTFLVCENVYGRLQYTITSTLAGLDGRVHGEQKWPSICVHCSARLVCVCVGLLRSCWGHCDITDVLWSGWDCGGGVSSMGEAQGLWESVPTGGEVAGRGSLHPLFPWSLGDSRVCVAFTSHCLGTHGPVSNGLAQSGPPLWAPAAPRAPGQPRTF